MTKAGHLQLRIKATVGRLLVDVDLATGPGTLVLVGPNGAGKSSLLSLVLGVLPVLEGRIAVGNDLLLDTETGIAVPLELRRLGYLPQDYALFPHLTVRENVEFALRSAVPRQSQRERTERAEEILAALGMDAYGAQNPATLSGGEKQKVALARALSVAPRALLLDEPLAALDIHSRGEVRSFLANYLKKLALPTIVVTHDAADARLLGQWIAVLESGKIAQQGTWDELSREPRTRFVREFVDSVL